MEVMYNGAFCQEQEVPALNRGLQFGDGLFETIIFEGSKPRYVEQHFARLHKGCELLALETPEVNEQTLMEWAVKLGAMPGHYYRAKWLVWRAGKAPYTPETSEVEQLFFMVESAKPNVQNLNHVALCESVQVGVHAWSEAKTLNALPYVIAAAEKKQRQLDELVLLNQQGVLAECSSSNLFWCKDGQLFTPSLASGCVAGVMRNRVIDFCKTEGITCNESLFLPEVLNKADSIFCTNVAQLGVFTQWQGTELKPLQEPIMARLGSLW